MKSLFTIDFEDFKNDFLVKNNCRGKYNFSALISTYDEIQNLLKNSGGNNYCTFFCTGNLAEKFPEIIKKISDDGHEIACHAYRHIDMSKLSDYDFEKDVDTAINFLNKASDQNINGYRAPMFSLPKEDTKKYAILEKYFKYDSSLIISSHEINDYFKNGMYKNTKLKVLPLYSKKTAFFNKKIIGGTYLKITRKKDLAGYFNEALEHNIYPVIYMHPYEFNDNKEFWVTMGDLKHSKLNILQKIYYQIRQHQWHSFNRNTLNKLTYLLERYPNEGRVDEYLEIKQ